jgi:hypothetical protein
MTTGPTGPAPAVASGAEVDTGTDNTKIVTAAALAASSIPGGWTPARQSWSWASASTINVPSGAASIYRKGDCVCFKQGAGFKYYQIVGVANTVLTFLVNTDYTVANSAISDNYYSHERPANFPDHFHFTPSWSNMTVGAGSNTGDISIVGNIVTMTIAWVFGTGAAIAPDAKLNMPVTLSLGGMIGVVSYSDASTGLSYMGVMRNNGYLKLYQVSGTLIIHYSIASTAPFTWTTSDAIYIEITGKI